MAERSDDEGGAAPLRPPVDRSIVALLVAVFCAATASLGGVTALGKQVYDLTQRELDLGLLGLAEFAPAALLVLVTGAVADRLDRRRVAAVAALGEAAAAGGLAAYAMTRPTAVGPIFALVLVFGVFRAFAAPATRAMPADIVAPEHLSWLTPRQSAAWQGALVVGPVLGGFLYALDPAAPYIAMAVLLVIASGAILVVRTSADTAAAGAAADEAASPAADRAAVEERARVEAAAVAAREPFPAQPARRRRGRPDRQQVAAAWHEALEGLRFIRRRPVLFGAISLDLAAVLFGGAVALLPAIADKRLGVGAVGLGWLRAAGGIGAAATTIVLSLRPLRHRVGPTLFVVVALFGVFTIVLGVTRSYVVAFLAVMLLSAADAVSVFIRATLVPLATPREMRGRVLAVENVFIGASNELGAFESGVAGAILGPAGAIVLGGTATLAVAGAWALWFPDLRRVDAFPTEPG